MVDVPFDAVAGISPTEVGEVELYHPKSWWTRYVFSQDAKVIAIQYSITALSIGMVALVLSWLMRLQLGFPGTFSFIDPNEYLQFITMHGMIMVIYLLTSPTAAAVEALDSNAAMQSEFRTRIWTKLQMHLSRKGKRETRMRSPPVSGGE
jgi:hypothetical protein